MLLFKLPVLYHAFAQNDDKKKIWPVKTPPIAWPRGEALMIWPPLPRRETQQNHAPIFVALDLSCN